MSLVCDLSTAEEATPFVYIGTGLTNSGQTLMPSGPEGQLQLLLPSTLLPAQRAASAKAASTAAASTSTSRQGRSPSSSYAPHVLLFRPLKLPEPLISGAVYAINIGGHCRVDSAATYVYCPEQPAAAEDARAKFTMLSPSLAPAEPIPVGSQARIKSVQTGLYCMVVRVGRVQLICNVTDVAAASVLVFTGSGFSYTGKGFIVNPGGSRPIYLGDRPDASMGDVAPSGGVQGMVSSICPQLASCLPALDWHALATCCLLPPAGVVANTSSGLESVPFANMVACPAPLPLPLPLLQTSAAAPVPAWAQAWAWGPSQPARCSPPPQETPQCCFQHLETPQPAQRA
jgi:hypothetical protein